MRPLETTISWSFTPEKFPWTACVIPVGLCKVKLYSFMLISFEKYSLLFQTFDFCFFGVFCINIYMIDRKCINVPIPKILVAKEGHYHDFEKFFKNMFLFHAI